MHTGVDQQCDGLAQRKQKRTLQYAKWPMHRIVHQGRRPRPSKLITVQER